MKTATGSFVLVLAFALTSPMALAEGLRILSWNITSNAFVEEAEEFQSLLRWADPDIVLLDEVHPSVPLDELHVALAKLRPGADEAWHVNYGLSGGRQRDIVASRAPQEVLPEFSTMIPYPEDERRYIFERMSGRERTDANLTMDNGIPVNAAIVLVDGRRMLAVITDMQCCGNDSSSWQEYRRQIEVREIRQRIEQVLERTEVDGLVIAGDFNLVTGLAAAEILNEPYEICPGGLSTAELYHPDGISNWTWDGRGMPFPNGRLDFQFYCSDTLEMRSGFVLESDAAAETGRHRPLVAEYGWK
jgi:endonuclease/exonuclease/phosphatase family metal-dependent hydrolase